MSASDSKIFIYLVQGQANLVKNYVHLRNRTSSHLISLTYDEPLDGSIYFPNSTWAEGRNRLLEEVAKLQYEYEYLIYCDDDVMFYMGDWDLFESEVLKYRPAVAVPVVSRTVRTIEPFPLIDVQRFVYNDEQLMAIRRDVIEDRKIVPYKTEYDSLHWWATCYAQELLIQKYYAFDTLQINRCRVLNLEHDRYTNDEITRQTYKNSVVTSLGQQLNIHFSLLNEYPSKTSLIFRTLTSKLKHKHRQIFCFFKGFTALLLKKLKFERKYTLKSLEDLISNKEHYVIYGFGEVGQQVLDLFQAKKLVNQLTQIIDQRAFLGNYQYQGFEVVSPKMLDISLNPKIIIASYGSINEIESLLLEEQGLSFRDLIKLRQ